MHKDLFTVFGYTVQTHSVISVMAILLAYGVGMALTYKTVYYKHLPNFIYYGIIGGIIGARLWHVFVFQWPYYSQHPLQIFAIWEGGISIIGAIVGGIAALLIYAYKHKLDFLDMADFLAPAMILGQGLGRIAETFAGDVPGSPTGGNFGLVFPKGTNAYDLYGSTPLWPEAVWESQGNFIIFSILLMLLLMAKKKITKGWIFALYIFLYSFERFTFAYLRGDAPRFLFGWTGGQWTMAVLMILSICFMAFLFFKNGLFQKGEQEGK